MRHALRAAGILLVAVLAGCASLSERQCRFGDWARIGRAAGGPLLSPLDFRY